jgi:hypothetical protein
MTDGQITDLIDEFNEIDGFDFFGFARALESRALAERKPCFQCGGCGDNNSAPGWCVRCNGSGEEPSIKPMPVAWRYFDGEGNYEFREEPPSESSVYHAAIYGRKFEPLYLAAHPTPDDAIRKLIARHAEELEQNDYAYFELAYTRRTEWMAWICSNHRDDDPNRKVIAQGQGSTPEEACAAAIDRARQTEEGK